MVGARYRLPPAPGFSPRPGRHRRRGPATRPRESVRHSVYRRSGNRRARRDGRQRGPGPRRSGSRRSYHPRQLYPGSHDPGGAGAPDGTPEGGDRSDRAGHDRTPSRPGARRQTGVDRRAARTVGRDRACHRASLRQPAGHRVGVRRRALLGAPGALDHQPAAPAARGRALGTTLPPLRLVDVADRPFFTTVNGYAYSRANYKLRWRGFPAILRAIVDEFRMLFREAPVYWREQALPEYLTKIERWKSVDLSDTPEERLLAGVRDLGPGEAHYQF